MPHTNLLLMIACLSLAAQPALTQSFVQVTEQAGLSVSLHSNGVAVADYDLDGDLDVYIVASDPYDPDVERSWNRFYRNDGRGGFTDVTHQAGVAGDIHRPEIGSMGNQFGAAWGDHDNDGYPDLFVTSLGPNVLYRNKGDGTFADVTATAGVVGREHDHNSSAVWWDYDLDGDLDLYVSAWIGANIMYENQGAGVFADVTETTALGDSGFTWSAVPFDANNDGAPDLYVVNDYGPNRFYLNRGDNTFEEATADFGLEDDGNGMGVDLGDYDNDGFFDIYLTNISAVKPCPLFRNNGDGTFTNAAKQAGVDNSDWAWGAEFFDSDHDGDQDLYVVNGFINFQYDNYFFKNMLKSDIFEFERPFFWDVSRDAGCNGSEEARGLVVFDYDNDGDMDMLVGNWWAKPHLYENRSETANYLKVKLEGVISNRDAFGARVKLVAGDLVIHRINDGVDFLGQSIMPLHFGVAAADIIDSLTVVWPNGAAETIRNIAVNQQIHLREGGGFITGVRRADSPVMEPASGFQLHGSFPNPFNGSTTIAFSLPNSGIVVLEVFDLTGRLVWRHKSAPLPVGRQQIQWHGVSGSGVPASSGFYIFRVRYAGAALSGKVLYLK